MGDIPVGVCEYRSWGLTKWCPGGHNVVWEFLFSGVE